MNELKNLELFKKLIRTNQVSHDTREVLNNTQLLLLAGVTSSGRNTVVGELLKTGDYHFVISDTTRKPRVNHGELEKNGNEYWFKTEEQFLAGFKNGEYLEAAIIHNQQVSGISVKEIKVAHDEKRIAVTDIEIEGVKSIIGIKSDAKCVFMLPPNFDEWLKRIDGRGKMEKTELTRRLKSAVIEIEDALDKDYFQIIVNNEFHETAKLIKNIFNVTPNQTQAKHVAIQLLRDVEKYLSKC